MEFVAVYRYPRTSLVAGLRSFFEPFLGLIYGGNERRTDREGAAHKFEWNSS